MQTTFNAVTADERKHQSAAVHNQQYQPSAGNTHSTTGVQSTAQEMPSIANAKRYSSKGWICSLAPLLGQAMAMGPWPRSPPQQLLMEAAPVCQQ
jgi:hypothetical protein